MARPGHKYEAFPGFSEKPNNHRAKKKMQHARLSPATAGQGKVIPFPKDTVPMAQRMKQSHHDCFPGHMGGIQVRSDFLVQYGEPFSIGSLVKQLVLKREVIHLSQLASSPHHPSDRAPVVPPSLKETSPNSSLPGTEVILFFMFVKCFADIKLCRSAKCFYYPLSANN